MNKMKKLFFTLFASCVISFGGFAQKKTNVIVILCDDMGYADLSCYGAKNYKTPTLDSLAKHGIRFTNYYAPQGVCTASRAGLLTGCYPNRIGIEGAFLDKDTIGLNKNEVTIAQMVKAKGYKTAIFGKWHLGHLEKFLPLQHGFDEFVGIPYSNDIWPVNFDGKPMTDPKSNITRFAPLFLMEGNKKIKPIATLQDQDQLTTTFTEKAVDFINRNHDNPFFIYLAHPMPHAPLGVSDKFRGKSGQGLYADVVMEIDWSVQQVIKALKKNKINDNTLIIFTSDNGPWLNFGNHAGSTGGLREGKGTSWDGGQKEPCIVSWPKKVPKNIISDKMISGIDILPTIAAITGAELPKNKIDGVNMLPLFENKKGADPRHVFLHYYSTRQLQAVQKDHWKLVFPHTYRSYEDVALGKDGFPGPYNYKKVTKMELYNLKDDPFERKDVYDQNPEIVKELQKIADEAREDIGDNLTKGKEKGKGYRPPGTLSKN